MKAIMIVISIIELILIVISIINLARANKYLNIKNQELEEIIDTKESNKELRFENEELNLFKSKVVNIINEKATIVYKHDKIKELVDNLQTEN